MIIQYLLNDLPAADEARFEEAYLRDGSLFEQVRALEEELIEDYVMGNLPEYERRRFELHYLASDVRRARVEAARELIGLCSLRSPVQFAKREAIGSKTYSFLSDLRSFVRRPLVLGFGIAYALLLVLGAFLVSEVLQLKGRLATVTDERATLARRGREAEQQLSDERKRQSEESVQRITLNKKVGKAEGQQKQRKLARPEEQTPKDGIVLLALAPGTRDIEQQRRAFISSETTYVDLAIMLERQKTSDLPPYRVILQTLDGSKEIWSKEGIKPRRKGVFQNLIVRVPAELLRASGEHYFMLLLSVPRAGSKGYEDLENYYFRLNSR
jgi:hypothetical protein